MVDPYLTHLGLLLGEPTGQGWTQIFELMIALACSTLIGLERELSQKSAGLRTHALVGVGAALFVLVSKYGFTDVLVPGEVVLDPSRVAAQIVTGIGFIGGGLIFVKRDAVQGLTTAAVVWMTAAIGAACGAGLPILAGLATAGHFLVVQGYPRLARRLGLPRFAIHTVDVRYRDGQGVLRSILAVITTRGFAIIEMSTTQTTEHDSGLPSDLTHVSRSEFEDQVRAVDVTLSMQGPPKVDGLAAALSEIEGVVAVSSGASRDVSE
jgi:putative Mg2+ transporter-C (MgtC) family protein